LAWKRGSFNRGIQLVRDEGLPIESVRLLNRVRVLIEFF
jgi:hypothetical protein